MGGLTATFADGDLFDVRWRGAEVIQRLYLAVRDEEWNTIPARFSNLVVTETGSRRVAELAGNPDYQEAWRNNRFVLFTRT